VPNSHPPILRTQLPNYTSDFIFITLQAIFLTSYIHVYMLSSCNIIMSYQVIMYLCFTDGALKCVLLIINIHTYVSE
jgi:hypothetical protein